MKQDIYTYNLTSDEDSVLLDMITFFDDMGWINESNQDAYESLSNKFFNNQLSWQIYKTRKSNYP